MYFHSLLLLRLTKLLLLLALSVYILQSSFSLCGYYLRFTRLRYRFTRLIFLLHIHLSAACHAGNVVSILTYEMWEIFVSGS